MVELTYRVFNKDSTIKKEKYETVRSAMFHGAIIQRSIEGQVIGIIDKENNVIYDIPVIEKYWKENGF